MENSVTGVPQVTCIICWGFLYMEIFESDSAEKTEQIAEAFAKKLVKGDVIAFRGGLGAGKTAFTRGLAKGLGINCDVNSPTFALLNVYDSGGLTLYHFDMYRILGYDALYSTGFFDYLDGDGILAVEWSENIEDELPENTITVTLVPTGENSRRIEIIVN